MAKNHDAMEMVGVTAAIENGENLGRYVERWYGLNDERITTIIEGQSQSEAMSTASGRGKGDVIY